MDAIGLFEAKTRLSEICGRVASDGVPVVIMRHGEPLVTIDPIPLRNGRPVSVWDHRAELEKVHGPFTEDFPLPNREKQAWRNPLGD